MRIRAKAPIVLLAAWPLLGAHPVYAQQAADSAWNRGDTEAAKRLYENRLAADSTDGQALHRLALLRAWDGRYEESLALFDRLLLGHPDDLEVALDRARVLAWKGDFDASLASLDSLARRAPSNPDVLAGLARVTSWSGRLAGGEALWRRAVAAAPQDPGPLLGLSETLRWQGRYGAAAATLREAERLAPADRRVEEEARRMRRALAPRVAPSLTYETDSDGNDILTAAFRATWRLFPRLEMRADGYGRRADLDGGTQPARRTGGLLIGISTELEPGWQISLAGGASDSDTPALSAIPSVRARLSTPRRSRLQASAGFATYALDATAQLIQNGVRVDDWDAAIAFDPGRVWHLAGVASIGSYRGAESNRHISGFFGVDRRISGSWSLGTALRGFGFEKDLAEGYFDPDRYLIAEIRARWHAEPGPWRIHLEGGPGVQQVGVGGSFAGTARGSGRVAYAFTPDRELGISLGYSSTGLQSFSTGRSDYRYFSLAIEAGWSF